jgi:hypothetical protein
LKKIFFYLMQPPREPIHNFYSFQIHTLLPGISSSSFVLLAQVSNSIVWDPNSTLLRCIWDNTHYALYPGYMELYVIIKVVVRKIGLKKRGLLYIFFTQAFGKMLYIFVVIFVSLVSLKFDGVGGLNTYCVDRWK